MENEILISPRENWNPRFSGDENHDEMRAGEPAHRIHISTDGDGNHDSDLH